MPKAVDGHSMPAIEQSSSQLTRRTLASGLVAGALAASTAVAGGAVATRIAHSAPATPDPIFAAIEAHRAADREWRRLLDMLDDDAPEKRDADVLEAAALINLLETTPTTLSGVVAMLRYLGPCMARYDAAPFGNFIEDTSAAGQTLFGRLADALTAGAAA